ncbi:hypothetical protein LCGC14_0692190 [marine sediment metagenome]|uniref:Uncharacterized protein n=2 Tax=marine sediment metagenome TaxID=412755 RepID=A0A0F9QQ22_9ZZZZ
MKIKTKAELVVRSLIVSGIVLGSFGVGAFISNIIPRFTSELIFNIGIVLLTLGVLLNIARIIDEY